MARIVAGVFNTVNEAEHAIQALLNAGFSDDTIGVVVRNRDIGPGLADDLGREYRSGFNPPANEMTSPSDVYEDLPGGFVKVVKGDTARADSLNWYDDQLNSGKILVIENTDRADDAMRIMRDNHAMMPSMTGAMPSQPTTTKPAMTPTKPMATSTTERDEMHVPVIEEEVVVEKLSHEVGAVEVTSETSSETVDIPTTVTHEEIRVERRKLDHPLHPDEYHSKATDEKGVIRMPIIEEEVRVTKSPIIREEIIVTRMPVVERQTLHETIMHSEPHVETTGKVDVEGMENLTEEERRRRPAA